MAQGKKILVQTPFFKIEPGEDRQTNPGCYGRAMANWLAGNFKKRGEPVEGVVAEDWGWCLILTRNPYPLWIGCRNDPDTTDAWAAFVAAEPSLFQRLFKRIDVQPALDRTQKLLSEAMHSVPDASKVWAED